MLLKVISPLGVVFEEEVEGFYIETNSGERGILNRHADFVSYFRFSEVLILQKNDYQQQLFVALGYVYVREEEAYIIAQFSGDDEQLIYELYAKSTKMMKESSYE